jgi:DUF4097 and DUF4098 domain-containing protein YvlB
MKNRWMVSSLVRGTLALLIVGGFAHPQKAEAVNVNGGAAGNEATKTLTGQEEHKTYQLTAGAHVDISNISGPVSVEATDGSSAEVHIYRTAPNPDDLAWRKVFIEQTSSGLTIRQKLVSGEPDSVNLLNRVVLKLPRRVSVTGKSISGDFNISGVDGAVDLNGISGSVVAKQLNGSLTVSSVSGNVRVPVARLNAAGVRVSGVSGNVYLGLASDLNAELSVGNTTAGVSNKIEGLALLGGPANYSARLGSGGPRIEVSGVTGYIVLQAI